MYTEYEASGAKALELVSALPLLIPSFFIIVFIISCFAWTILTMYCMNTALYIFIERLVMQELEYLGSSLMGVTNGVEHDVYMVRKYGDIVGIYN